ncbi:membrane protein [Bordetella pertussis]|nr:membrane protein [Bordetella pertussis]
MNQGLLYLAASVACSVTVAVLLKLARRHAIDVRQAIAVNYAVAAALCWLLLRPDAQALRQAMQATRRSACRCSFRCWPPSRCSAKA